MPISDDPIVEARGALKGSKLLEAYMAAKQKRKELEKLRLKDH